MNSTTDSETIPSAPVGGQSPRKAVTRTKAQRSGKFAARLARLKGERRHERVAARERISVAGCYRPSRLVHQGGPAFIGGGQVENGSCALAVFGSSAVLKTRPPSLSSALPLRLTIPPHCGRPRAGATVFAGCPAPARPLPLPSPASQFYASFARRGRSIARKARSSFSPSN